MSIWVLCEERGGALHPVCGELIAEARRLAEGSGHSVTALIAGADIGAAADKLRTMGADMVLGVNITGAPDGPLSAQAVANAAAPAIIGGGPDILLAGSTFFGRELAPLAAALIGAGLTSDCVRLGLDPGTGLLLQTRPAYGGGLMTTVVSPVARPQMVTARPGVLRRPALPPFPPCPVEIRAVPFPSTAPAAKILRLIGAGREKVDLAGAKIIVSGGRGVRGAEGFSLIRALADRLGGEVGASRASVNEGWIDPSHQVGQTGAIVRPDLYIACGISGSMQHIAGMGASKYIVAINTDPNAPIFRACDLGITGDLREIIPAILGELDSPSRDGASYF